MLEILGSSKELLMKTQNQALLDDFIDCLWLEEGLSQNTLNSYRQDLKQFTAWLETQAEKAYWMHKRRIFKAIWFFGIQPASHAVWDV